MRFPIAAGITCLFGLSLHSIDAHAINMSETPGNACGLLLAGGVFDQQKSLDNTQLSQAFSRWFCSNQMESTSDSLGIGLNIPIDEVLVGFSLDKRSQSEKKKSFCENINSSLSYRSLKISSIKKVSDVLVKGFNECMQQPGVHFSIEYSFDPHIFTIITKKIVSSNADTAPATVKRFDTTDNVKCKGDPPKNVDLAGDAYICNRTDDNAAIISLSTDGVQSVRQISLPKIIDPKPQCPNLQGSWRDSYWGNTLQITQDVGGCFFTGTTDDGVSSFEISGEMQGPAFVYYGKRINRSMGGCSTEFRGELYQFLPSIDSAAVKNFQTHVSETVGCQHWDNEYLSWSRL